MLRIWGITWGAGSMGVLGDPKILVADRDLTR